MDLARTQRLIDRAIKETAAGQFDEAGGTLAQLGKGSDAWQMYAVCTAFAAAGAYALKYIHGEAIAPAAGRMLVIQEPYEGAAAADPPGAWAMRFLTAHTNGDKDMTHALYFAALDASGEEFVASVSRLLRLAGDLTARATAHEKAQKQRPPA
ncbi:hypothetical protein [Streptomyces sp. NBC_01207]|uniref:hypothetical protein n=1 Tax=Streptomyces sp. NBC_01207 TaxID=2903772 RepID=UPI002E11BC2D|nr:hypothetical protein OG457_27195 [Streptomyces sp. NBC_01207]